MIGWLLLVGGVAFGGYEVYKHVTGNPTLDAGIPAPIAAQVLAALHNEDDPVKLDALADQLPAYPKAAALLRAKAATIRSHQHAANPPSVSPPIVPATYNPPADHVVATQGQDPGQPAATAAAVQATLGTDPGPTLTQADCPDGYVLVPGLNKCVPPDAPSPKNWQAPAAPPQHDAVAEGDGLGAVNN